VQVPNLQVLEPIKPLPPHCVRYPNPEASSAAIASENRKNMNLFNILRQLKFFLRNEYHLKKYRLYL
jgi:hypothetical protein